MRVETKLTRVYIFTAAEVDQLAAMGVWALILGRLKDNERIKVE